VGGVGGVGGGGGGGGGGGTIDTDVPPHTVAHPRTVVIHFEHTSTADRTVMGAIRLESSASAAVSNTVVVR
jgi:hypothetical protein